MPQKTEAVLELVDVGEEKNETPELALNLGLAEIQGPICPYCGSKITDKSVALHIVNKLISVAYCCVCFKVIPVIPTPPCLFNQETTH